MKGPMIPEKDGTTVYDYFYDIQIGSWKTWSSRIADAAIPPETPIRSIVVPTIDTVRYTYMLDTAICHGYPCLFVGPTGTGPQHAKRTIMH